MQPQQSMQKIPLSIRKGIFFVNYLSHKREKIETWVLQFFVKFILKEKESTNKFVYFEKK